MIWIGNSSSFAFIVDMIHKFVTKQLTLTHRFALFQRECWCHLFHIHTHDSGVTRNLQTFLNHDYGNGWHFKTPQFLHMLLLISFIARFFHSLTLTTRHFSRFIKFALTLFSVSELTFLTRKFNIDLFWQKILTILWLTWFKLHQIFFSFKHHKFFFLDHQKKFEWTFFSCVSPQFLSAFELECICVCVCVCTATKLAQFFQHTTNFRIELNFFFLQQIARFSIFNHTSL